MHGNKVENQIIKNLLIVKLNLFNYVLALFLAKFACNSAFRNLVLGDNNVRVVCESVKIWSRVCNKKVTCDWTRYSLASGDLPKWSTCVKHARRWRVRIARPLQDKKYSLIFLLTSDWNSWLIPVAKWLASAPYFAKTWLFTFHLISYYKYPYTHEM